MYVPVRLHSIFGTQNWYKKYFAQVAFALVKSSWIKSKKRYIVDIVLQGKVLKMAW